jgi:hypothetical protein
MLLFFAWGEVRVAAVAAPGEEECMSQLVGGEKAAAVAAQRLSQMRRCPLVPAGRFIIDDELKSTGSTGDQESLEAPNRSTKLLVRDLTPGLLAEDLQIRESPSAMGVGVADLPSELRCRGGIWNVT